MMHEMIASKYELELGPRNVDLSAKHPWNVDLEAKRKRIATTFVPHTNYCTGSSKVCINFLS
jgi:hypothetical protein